VAEVTGLDVDFILMGDMPVACGRQYEHIFYIKHGIECESISGEEGEEVTLQTVI
jgi:hypothetical protein